MGDFGLGDWPPGGVSRDHAVHVAYCRAVRRAGGCLVEYVSPAEVAKRGKWTCWACGEPVPQRWDAAGAARAPALAFTVPLEDGGRYVKANARLAHLGCARISDPLLAKALSRALGGDPNARVRAGKDDETCLQGHRLAAANLLKAADGRRRCRQCRNDRERAVRSAAS